MKLFKQAVTATVAFGISTWVMAQTMPSTPLPTGVTSANNPLDTGVSVFKKMAQYGFVGAAIFLLLIAAYIAIPAILAWVGGKKQFGEAAGQMVGGLFLAIFGIAVGTYGFTQVGTAGGAP